MGERKFKKILIKVQSLHSLNWFIRYYHTE